MATVCADTPTSVSHALPILYTSFQRAWGRIQSTARILKESYKPFLKARNMDDALEAMYRVSAAPMEQRALWLVPSTVKLMEIDCEVEFPFLR